MSHVRGLCWPLSWFIRVFCCYCLISIPLFRLILSVVFAIYTCIFSALCAADASESCSNVVHIRVEYVPTYAILLEDVKPIRPIVHTHHKVKMPVALHIFFLTTLLIANAHANNESEKGSIVFTDSSSKQLLRLDDGAGIPRVIAHDIATYGGLPPSLPQPRNLFKYVLCHALFRNKYP